jgi:ribosomal protein S13
MQKTVSRAERLGSLSETELENLYNLLSYGYFDERALKLDVQREIQRRHKPTYAEAWKAQVEAMGNKQ